MVLHGREQIVPLQIIRRPTGLLVTSMAMSAIVEPLVESEECPQCLLGNLNWLLAQAHYALASELATAFEPLGVSPRGHSVLAAAMTGTYTQKELAELVGLDKTTMVVTVDELEAAGFAERRASQTDRRTRVIVATKAGERKVREAEMILDGVREDVLSTLPESERGVFLRALGRLVCGRLSEPVACVHTVRRRA